MDSNTQPTVVINLKDLFFVLLRKIGLILLVGIILAGALFGYKYSSAVKDSNVLDITKKLDGETEAQYSTRTLNVERAEDIIIVNNAINEQIEKQRKYIANSLFMQIDYENEAITTAQVVITVEDNYSAGADKALFEAYLQDIQNGDYREKIADGLGIERDDLSDLVIVSYDLASTSTIKTNEVTQSTGIFKISVKGTTTDSTESIMNQILEEIDDKSNEFIESMVPHTVILIGEQSYYGKDTGTRDLQQAILNQIVSYQKQLETNNESLDDLASEIGVSKDNLYAYFSFSDESWINSSPSMRNALKYAFLGFAIGAFLVMAVIVMKYIFGKKFNTQAVFFSRFPQVYRIGVVKPADKRSRYSRFIDRKTGDDNELSYENSISLMAADIKNLTSGMDKILFTGTADISKIKELVDKLGVRGDVKESFFSDPAILEAVSEYECVILVEQRNYSDSKQIADELKYIANADTKLIGAIVI